MASSRKRASGRKLAVALSGGVDSVTLLHQLRARGAVTAIHVHHGLSPNADRWAAFCRRLCKRLDVPLAVVKVRVAKRGQGLEAAAREARYQAFSTADAECIALAHNLDDQAETVLMNLLRGAGRRGASGMPARTRFKGKTLLRPLLETPRAEIEAYARRHRLAWIDDESNADESLTRNFVRRRIAPLLDQKYPQWRRSLSRAARHFSRREAGAQDLLRKFLQTRGLRAPSEAKLVEMLKQLTGRGARTLIEHDGARLRVYRGKVVADQAVTAFAPIAWRGEPSLPIPALGGELRFRRARGKGIDASKPLRVRLRAGGERLQPDAKRPRRTLKNLFQEAGVPPWERDRLPLLVCGDDLVWVPGLGVDARYRAPKNAPGVLPEWRKMSG
jgi:tRNA(Ile)-lysidine synthase